MAEYQDKVWIDDLFAEEIESRVVTMLAEQEAGMEGDLDDIPDTPSGEPWDGCEECYRREIMCLTVILTLKGVLSGHIRAKTSPQAGSGHPSTLGPRLRLVEDPD